jgi:four helix bundle protein
MKRDGSEISERLLDFAASIVKLVAGLNKTNIDRHIGGQLARSATSAGANYEEACGAESRADFIHKLQIVLKELRETIYWLRLIEKSDLQSHETLQEFMQEANELANIIGKSVVTAKRNR